MRKKEVPERIIGKFWSIIDLSLESTADTYINQGGGTPLQSVLRAVTAIKILTEKFYDGIA